MKLSELIFDKRFCFILGFKIYNKEKNHVAEITFKNSSGNYETNGFFQNSINDILESLTDDKIVVSCEISELIKPVNKIIIEIKGNLKFENLLKNI